MLKTLKPQNNRAQKKWATDTSELTDDIRKLLTPILYVKEKNYYITSLDSDDDFLMTKH